jgi:hypothetical protein
MHKTLSPTKIALICAMVMAFVCLHTRANAQETTTFQVSAVISANTCVLKMADAKGASYGGTRSVTLPTTNPTSGSAAGAPLGTPVTVELSLVSSSDTATSCYTALDTITKWDIYLTLSADQISTLNSKTYLRNAIAGGSDAVVKLKGCISYPNNDCSSFTELTLQSGTQTLVSGNSTPTAQSKAVIKLQAQLTQAGSTSPTAGSWAQTIPLTIAYQ